MRNHITPVYGKLPPQATDHEDALLGAILIDRDCHDLIDTMEIAVFYRKQNQTIFEAVKSLRIEKKSIDILTVTEKLKQYEKLAEVGGALYITQLTSKVSSGLRANEWYYLVLEKYILREGIRLTSEIQDICFDSLGDIEEVEFKINELKSFFDAKIYSENVGESLYEVSRESITNAKTRKHNRDNGIMPGINTGIGALQQITGGWQQADLIYIGARPSMGKTAFAIFLAKQSAMAGVKTIFFSLEMNNISITDRAVLGGLDIDPEKWRNGEISNYHFSLFEDKQKVIRQWPLILFDKQAKRPAQIAKICKREKPGIIFIDYLQLMYDDKGEKHANRNSEVENISRKLKDMAKEFNCPVICLSQLNRSLERGKSKVPMLSDLRDSGSIEQDADLVIFPYRPYVYFEEPENLEVMELHIAKHRNGRVGTVVIKHNKYINEFYDTPFSDEGKKTEVKEDEIPHIEDIQFNIPIVF